MMVTVWEKEGILKFSLAVGRDFSGNLSLKYFKGFLWFTSNC